MRKFKSCPCPAGAGPAGGPLRHPSRPDIRLPPLQVIPSEIDSFSAMRLRAGRSSGFSQNQIPWVFKSVFDSPPLFHYLLMYTASIELTQRGKCEYLKKE